MEVLAFMEQACVAACLVDAALCLLDTVRKCRRA